MIFIIFNRFDKNTCWHLIKRGGKTFRSSWSPTIEDHDPAACTRVRMRPALGRRLGLEETPLEETSERQALRWPWATGGEAEETLHSELTSSSITYNLRELFSIYFLESSPLAVWCSREGSERQHATFAWANKAAALTRCI